MKDGEEKDQGGLMSNTLRANVNIDDFDDFDA